jgi:glucose-6-phosphate isomerase
VSITEALGPAMADASKGLAQIQQQSIAKRIWQKDYTVWKNDPTEISNRLGWLTVASDMRQHAGELAVFADGVRSAGFKDLVLLGMGGSSLAPEVLRLSFGKISGCPNLHVLDSTVPAWVRRVTRSIDPAHTLFIVSSKSGGTIEVMSFFKHFYGLVSQQLGESAGESFIAITDPGTSLQKMAETYHFRRCFINPPDIGGRYSALSYFGLVPAALAGVQAGELLARSLAMAESCSANVAAPDNPGAWLGAVLGALGNAGRNKVTFLTSPAIASFGLWAEQLIAESTGKEGKGLVPIALEPPAAATAYGDDRLFVYLRLDGDSNTAADAQAAVLEKAQKPLIRLALHDRYDLGAEFFRWEFATALAGALIGIQPFDQPNVQESKDNTATVLRQVQETGKIPDVGSTGSFGEILTQARPGDYLALMAYVDETPETGAALHELRLAVLQRRHLANSLGYGPRFLHSTGQLHKGGPNSGLFVQLTADWGEDVLVPGEKYTFAGLAAAQVTGDYQSLVNHGRRVVRIHLGDNVADGLRRLITEVA